MSKEALRSDLVKDAASGAAVGAAIAIPVPVVGPLAGATVGAGLGVYKNIIKKEASAGSRGQVAEPKDIHTELLKLDELRNKNIINQEEFEKQKKVLLREQF